MAVPKNSPRKHLRLVKALKSAHRQLLAGHRKGAVASEACDRVVSRITPAPTSARGGMAARFASSDEALGNEAHTLVLVIR